MMASLATPESGGASEAVNPKTAADIPKTNTQPLLKRALQPSQQAVRGRLRSLAKGFKTEWAVRGISIGASLFHSASLGTRRSSNFRAAFWRAKTPVCRGSFAQIEISTDLALADKHRHAFHGDFDLVEAGGEAAADVPLAARAERGSGNDGDLVLLQKLHGKLPAREPG